MNPGSQPSPAPVPTSHRLARPLMACLLAAASAPALAGSAVITPNGFDFGNVTVGQTSAVQVFTLNNPTADPITITSASLGGAAPAQYLLVASSCAGVIAPAGHCTMSVRFNPAAIGSQVALIRVLYTAPPPAGPGGIEVNATLFGNGVAAPVQAPSPVPGPGAIALTVLALLSLGAGVRACRQRTG